MQKYFQEEKKLFGKCFFYIEMLGMTFFGIVLVDFLVDAMIVVNKYIVKWSRKSFMDFFKI